MDDVSGPFDGFEPQVGEIMAVRTFRIGPSGLLYPLFGTEPWTAGTNTAWCLHHPPARSGDARSGDDGEPGTVHVVPDPECRCGFYAYAGPTAAGDYSRSAHVLAVVACWGRVIAGTRGVRAEHSRVEALWTSSTVPKDLVRAVAHAYPDVDLYTDRYRMLREHPATMLDCYEPQAVELVPRSQILLWRASVLGALGAGTVAPLGALGALGALGMPARAALWTLAAGLFALAIATGRLRADGEVASGRRTMMWATVLWVAMGVIGFRYALAIRAPMASLVPMLWWLERSEHRNAATFPADVTRADDFR